MPDPQQQLIRSFREIQPKFSRLYSRVLTTAKLTLPQYALLTQLAVSAPEPLSMTTISTRLYITKPAVTNLVDRLEKNKLVKRARHPQDRRIYLLQIQPKGQKVVKRVQSYVLGILLANLKPLTREEKEAVSRFYGLLSNTLDKMLRDFEKASL